jgi:hypothetical protein
VLDEGNELDEVMGALVKRLQVMPASDPRMRAAILARVRGRRQTPWRATLSWVSQPAVPMLAAAALAVVAIGIGYAGRVLVEPVTAIADVPAQRPVTPVLVPVSNDMDAARSVPEQFILQQRGANRVRLVGDFNGWGATAIDLTDATRSGVWEVTVALLPGRHTYAYLVNDSLLVLDPHMPTTTDRDFGRVSSVILVNR